MIPMADPLCGGGKITRSLPMAAIPLFI